MKTKILIFGLIAGFFVLTNSCTDEFLKEDARTGNNEKVYLTANGLTGLMNSCYTYTRVWYGKEAALGLAEAGTDLWLAGRDNKQKNMVEYASITPVTGTDLCFEEYWEILFTAVNACNTAIKYCDLNTDLSDATLKQYKGEAQFLRAFYYWHLVETWGPVPIYKVPTETSTSDVSRDNEADVYDFMLQDVNNAIINLDDKITKNGRVNKWAAKALKARLLLYLASEYNGGNYGKVQAYTDAAATAQEVIDESGASFYTNYADCWLQATEDGKTNDEAIWYVEYSQNISENVLPLRSDGSKLRQVIVRASSGNATTQGGNALHLMFTGQWNNDSRMAKILVRTDSEAKKTISGVYVGAFFQPYSKGFTRYAPSGYLLDLFDETKDQRYQATFRDTYKTFPALVANKTTALFDGTTSLTTDTCIYLSKHKTADLTAEEIAAFNGGAVSKYVMGVRSGLGALGTAKYSMYTNEEGSQLTTTSTTNSFYGNNLFISLKKFDDYGTTSDGSLPIIRDLGVRDFMVFRLSEMYLIKAEAELGSSSGDALSTINALRTARAISGQDNTLAGPVTIQTILDERAIELCGEYQRWFDLKRLGKLNATYLTDKNLNAANNIQSHHRLRPIPQVQIDATTNIGAVGEAGKFWQNPGY